MRPWCPLWLCLLPFDLGRVREAPDVGLMLPRGGRFREDLSVSVQLVSHDPPPTPEGRACVPGPPRLPLPVWLEGEGPRKSPCQGPGLRVGGEAQRPSHPAVRPNPEPPVLPSPASPPPTLPGHGSLTKSSRPPLPWEGSGLSSVLGDLLAVAGSRPSLFPSLIHQEETAARLSPAGRWVSPQKDQERGPRTGTGAPQTAGPPSQC